MSFIKDIFTDILPDVVKSGIGLAVGAVGSKLTGGSEKKAADAQAQAAKQAGDYSLQAAREVIAMQQKQYDQSRTDLAPYRETGYRALDKQASMLGLNPVGTPARINQAANQPQSAPVAAPTAQPVNYADIPGLTDLANQGYQQYLATGVYPQDIANQLQAYNQPVINQPVNQPVSAPINQPVSQAATIPQTASPLTDVSPTDTSVTVDEQGNILPTNSFIATTGPDYSAGAFEQSPSYRFLLDEGRKAIDKRAAAAGSFYSGAPMKELARYTAGLASTDYENWFNRTRMAYTDQYERNKGEYADYFNQLAGISGTGQTASYNTAQLGANNAVASGNALLSGSSDYANSIVAGGDIRASGVLAANNAKRNTMFDIASLFV